MEKVPEVHEEPKHVDLGPDEYPAYSPGGIGPSSSVNHDDVLRPINLMDEGKPAKTASPVPHHRDLSSPPPPFSSGRGVDQPTYVTTQPTGRSPMSIATAASSEPYKSESSASTVIDPLNPLGKMRTKNGEREWSYGLCNCSSRCGTCCFAWWCPCMAYGQVKSKVHHLQIHGTPHPEGGEICGSGTWIYVALNMCYFGPILQCLNRADLRTRYRIGGNCCGDFMTACFCSACELTQELREVHAEEQVVQNRRGQINY